MFGFKIVGNKRYQAFLRREAELSEIKKDAQRHEEKIIEVINRTEARVKTSEENIGIRLNQILERLAKFEEVIHDEGDRTDAIMKYHAGRIVEQLQPQQAVVQRMVKR